MYIVNVNNFRPFDLFILLNAAFRNSNIAFSHAALDICLRRAYNALKRTVRQCPSGSYGDAEAAAGYNYKAYFVIPILINFNLPYFIINNFIYPLYYIKI